MDNFNREMLKKKIEEFGKEMLKKVKREDITYLVKDEITFGSGGQYNIPEKKITLQIKSLIKEYQKIIKGEGNENDLLFYMKVVFLHELGHALDSNLPKNKNKLQKTQISFYRALFFQENSSEKLLKKCKKIVITEEKVAWKNAEKFLSNKEKNRFYYRMKKHCLASYFRLWHEMKYSFHLEDVFSYVRSFSIPFDISDVDLNFSMEQQFGKSINHSISKNSLEFNLPSLVSYLKDEKKLEEHKVIMLFQILEETVALHLEKTHNYQNKLDEIEKKIDIETDEHEDYEKALILSNQRKKMKMERFDEAKQIVEKIIKKNESLLVPSYRKYSKEKREKEYNNCIWWNDYIEKQRKLG